MHETRNHSICLYNIMVSSHQSHTWEQRPLYLSTTPWSLLTNSIHETMDHSICLYNIMGEETMMLYRQIEWSLVSCMGLVRRDHDVVTMDHSICLYNIMVSSHQSHTWEQRPLYLSTTPWSLLTNSIHETMDHSICLCNIMVSSHQLYSWDHGPLYLSIQHHGLFSPRYSGRCSHVWDWWEETMMLYREIEWFLVSWIELVRRDHGVV
jgi:hypothetical protein